MNKYSSIKDKDIFHKIDQEFYQFQIDHNQSNFKFTKSMIDTTTESKIKKYILYKLLDTQIQFRQNWIIQAIIKYTKEYEFFKKYQSKHQQCAKFLRLAIFKSGAQIVQYQSDPEEFFFLLQGQGLIFLKKTSLEIQNEKLQLQNSNNNLTQSIDDNCNYLLNKKHFVHNIPKFKKISSVREGASFGELGILYNRPRIAMIIAKTDCILTILSKQHYLSIFCEMENKQRKFKRDFIFDNFFIQFKNLKYELCQAILYSFREKKYRINEYIFKEGEIFDGFFLIKSGESVISKKYLNKSHQISIVSKGYFLCYQQLKKTLQNNEACKLSYSAQVSSAQLTTYTLSYKQMQRIFNFKSVLHQILNNNISYLKYLQNNSKNFLKQQIQKKQNLNSINLNNQTKKIIRQNHQQITKTQIQNQLKKLMLSTLFTCDKHVLNQQVKRLKVNDEKASLTMSPKQKKTFRLTKKQNNFCCKSSSILNVNPIKLFQKKK